MSLIAPVNAQPAALTKRNAERLLVGIPADTFARFARPGGVVVQSNHPAFVFGHLALYPGKAATALAAVGVTAARSIPAAPDGWDALFKNGAPCVDDATGTTYPPMRTITDYFYASYNAAIAVIAEATDAQLGAPNPTEGPMRERFPIVGGMLAFYLSGHAQNHFGQLSAWRRMMGLPPA